ncbi:hypothetical protein PFISCL1PPCAC_10072, partial [Pristionchus fissidentatus]
HSPRFFPFQTAEMASELMSKVEELLRHPKIDGHLTKIEQITHLKRETLISLLLIGAVAAFVVSSWLSIICSIAGLLLPAIKSIKALTSGSHLDHWVKYWMIYATISLADSFHFIPYYHLLKALLLVYISISSSAVDKLFTSYVGPAVTQLETLLTPYIPQSLLDLTEKKEE